MKEWQVKTRATIERFPMKKETEANMPTVLRKLISTYLVHHGYSATAEAFAKSVGHVFEEELASIRNRQRIQNALMNGYIGEAIELTRKLFPGILDKNPNLLFALKIRKFIEMVNGSENETKSSRSRSISRTHSPVRNSAVASSNGNHSTGESRITDLNMEVDAASDNASFNLLSEANGKNGSLAHVNEVRDESTMGKLF